MSKNTKPHRIGKAIPDNIFGLAQLPVTTTQLMLNTKLPEPFHIKFNPIHGFFLILAFLLSACHSSRNAEKSAYRNLLNDPAFAHAHTGISIYDPLRGSYLYNYQGDKYFVPASNTKIITLFAGMKWLGDSLPGLRYWTTADTIFVQATGDPTLLHPDYRQQTVYGFLRQATRPLAIDGSNWGSVALGEGWSWDDYNEDYMVERSPLPVYGNFIKWIQAKDTSQHNPLSNAGDEAFVYSEPEVNWKVDFSNDTVHTTFSVRRVQAENVYIINQGKEKYKVIEVPFVTHGLESALELLKDTLHKTITLLATNHSLSRANSILIHSRPSDSLFRMMMGRSDNFFAEQILQMVSNERWGIMDEKKLIGELLKGELNGFPQQPSWVDGSGLSRYNLFSPQDFVWILTRMEKEFGMNRLKILFPTGGTGTLKNYYRSDSGYLFAKTGTLSGVVSLSGFLYTKRNRLFIFSVLVNNHLGNTTVIRQKVEKFLESIRSAY